VIAVVSVFLLLVALALVLQVKKLLGSLAQQVQPVTDRARVAAENVEYISAMVREDVQSVRTSVSGLSERLKDASDRMEERVEEFNALMDVVQDEAEAVLLDTAAVVRGVRAGAQTMGEGVAGATPARDAEGSDGEDDSEGESDVGEAMAREAPERG
jgi:phage shock protein A